ncbi:MAG: trypsin-like peptidase domain-containing protein, partial [Anaerolineae bacterium]|nr:trypsin-like peptidase domain-containing protein [Anaerolineae bacterium]
MKNLRYVTLVVLLVSVLGLSACSAAIPSAFSLVDNFVVNRRTAAPVAASVVAAAPPPQLPAARPAAKALIAGDLQERLEEIYSSVNPAVVNIRVAVKPTAATGNLPQIPGMPNFFSLPDGEDEEGDLPNAPMAMGEGSGFVWDTQGHLVTNNHVVDSAEKVLVTFADGTTVPATVVGVDPESDLAVIKVDSKAVKLQPITVGDSNNAKVGQFVVAIGNPFGLAGSMSFGIVSALGRSLPANGENALLRQGPGYTIPDIIQTDAPVNPGNSGGVLLDLDGNLVGVPTAIESPVRGSTGVGFAVPAAIVKQVVPELIKNGKFVHPWIGISGGTLAPVVAKEMGLPETQRGALVATVTAGGPAEKAGLVGSTKSATIDGQEIEVGGDVITAIDGQPVKRFEDLVTFLARNGKVGQTVKLTILRDGKEMTVALTLAARPGAKAAQGNTQPQATPQQRGNRGNQGQPQPGQPQATPAPRGNQGAAPQGSAPQTAQGAWLGVAGIDMTAELAEATDLDADQTGALIQQVVPNSPAAKAGLKAGTEDFDLNGETVKVGGDVVVSANGKNVETMQDLVKIVQGMKSGDKLNLTVLRDGKETKVTVTLATRPTAEQPQQGQPQ